MTTETAQVDARKWWEPAVGVSIDLQTYHRQLRADNYQLHSLTPFTNNVNIKSARGVVLSCLVGPKSISRMQ